MPILHARFISLDSSILGNLARDYFSSSAQNRQAARSFIEALSLAGVVPLLCWHQFEELIKHENLGISKERFAFLESLPHVAWLRADSGPGLGSIVDLLIAECREALRTPGSNICEVRDITRVGLFEFGTGAEAVRPYVELWESLRPRLWEQEKRARELVAISRADVIDISARKLSSFLKGSLRTREDSLALLAQFQGTMSEEVRSRGDKRITNAEDVASKFYAEVAADSVSFYEGSSFDFELTLNRFGVSLEDFGPDARMGEMMELSEFRQKLRVAYKAFNMPWDGFKRSISPKQIPSWTIESSIREFGQRRFEHKGSELNDRHLLCLSPYCNLTYVDKQVSEDLKRALAKSESIRSIMNRVEKNTLYERIGERIAANDL